MKILPARRPSRPSVDKLSLAKPAARLPRQKREIATSFLKGLDLLTLLARSPAGLTGPEVCQRLKLPRTSVLRMLATLEQFGLIAHQDKQWGTTERFHQWCDRDMYREIKARYHRALHAMAGEIDELVELGRRRRAEFTVERSGRAIADAYRQAAAS